MTSCWRDTHPQAADWNPSEHPGWHQLLDFDGGSLCRESRHVVPWYSGSAYCADIGVRVPWCTAYRAQWVSDQPGGTGPLLHVRWVPEADGLVAGLVALALLKRFSVRR